MNKSLYWKIGVVALVLIALMVVVQVKRGPTVVVMEPPVPPAAAEAPLTPPPAADPGSELAVAPPATEVAAAKPMTSPAPTTGTPKPSPPRPASGDGEILGPPVPPKPAATAPPPATKPAPAEKRLPRMLELGSVTCIPCKMMVPVIDALKEEYAGRLTVEFINVMEDRASAEKYQIQSIPTQILFDRSGQEVFRHIGYWPKAEIVAKCKELGLLS